MARMGNFDISALKEFQKKLEKINQSELDAFVEGCAKELAARLLRMVIKRTPVRKAEDCPPGVKGGTLRRGWTSQKGSGSEELKTRGAAQFVDTLKVHHFGDTYVIEIVNSVEYASYVEYGHRTRDHKGWVSGRFMMTLSENDLRDIAPKVLENKLKKFLGGVLS